MASKKQNPWITDLHWVRPGKQTRSQKTQEALLDAAEALFGEQGVEATSVADVAARAGCSVGAVYHHFRDKTALLYAHFERMSETMRETVKVACAPERWEGAGIADVLRGYLEFSLDGKASRPGLKVAAFEVARTDPQVRERLDSLRTEVNDAIRALLVARRDEITHPSPNRAIDFVLDQLTSMLITRMDSVLHPMRLAKISNEKFVDEAIQSACAYLGVDDGAPKARKRR